MCSYQRKPAVGTKQVGVCGSRGGRVQVTRLPFSTPGSGEGVIPKLSLSGVQMGGYPKGLGIGLCLEELEDLSLIPESPDLRLRAKFQPILVLGLANQGYGRRPLTPGTQPSIPNPLHPKNPKGSTAHH